MRSPLAVCALLSLLALVGLVVFRDRPDKVQVALQAGETPEFIEQQRAFLRRMRRYFWLILLIAVLLAAVLLVPNHKS